MTLASPTIKKTIAVVAKAASSSSSSSSVIKTASSSPPPPTSRRSKDRGVPFEEMRRLMRVYGSIKCLRKRQAKSGGKTSSSPGNGDGNNRGGDDDEEQQQQQQQQQLEGVTTKIGSVKRKFYRWFPDLDERFVKDEETGRYEPKVGHVAEMKYREDMRTKDGVSLAKKRVRCRMERHGSGVGDRSGSAGKARVGAGASYGGGGAGSAAKKGKTDGASVGGDGRGVPTKIEAAASKAPASSSAPPALLPPRAGEDYNVSRAAPVSPVSFVGSSPPKVTTSSTSLSPPFVDRRTNDEVVDTRVHVEVADNIARDNAEAANDEVKEMMSAASELEINPLTDHDHSASILNITNSVEEHEPFDYSFVAEKGIFDQVDNDFFGQARANNAQVNDDDDHRDSQRMPAWPSCSFSSSSSDYDEEDREQQEQEMNYLSGNNKIGRSGVDNVSFSSWEGNDDSAFSSSSVQADDNALDKSLSIKAILDKSIEECCDEILMSGVVDNDDDSVSGFFVDMISS